MEGQHLRKGSTKKRTQVKMCLLHLGNNASKCEYNYQNKPQPGRGRKDGSLVTKVKSADWRELEDVQVSVDKMAKSQDGCTQ